MQMAIDIRGEGAPLMLVGGGVTGWLTWIPHQERLAPGRRVGRAQPLNVQLGLQRAPLPADYSVGMESRALGEGLDAAGLLGPIDLVAWSYGALVALDFALDHPDRIRTLTLIEPPAFWVLDETGQLDERSAGERDRLKALHDGMNGEVSEDQLADFLVQIGMASADVDLRLLPLWPVWVKHCRSLLQGPAVFAHRDRLARLEAFDRPVLLVKGKSSSYALRRIVDALGAAMPHARVAEMRGGHAPQLESATDFLRILADFQSNAVVPA